MIKNFRREVANAISPDKSHSYPIVELKLATAEESNNSYMKLVHERFEKQHGRKAMDDEEAWNYDRKVLDDIWIEIEEKELMK